MVASDLTELREMASLLYLRQSWLRGTGGVPHFDLNEHKRGWAIHHGAIPIDDTRLRELVRRWRAALAADPRTKSVLPV